MTTLESDWRLRFERFGRRYAEDHDVSGWSAEGLARRLVLFEGLVGDLGLPPGARVLELGCGAGTYVRRLAACGYRTIGLDYSVSSLARAMAAGGESSRSYVGADGYALPFRAASFDFVVSIGVLQVVTRPPSFIREVARVVRPGGLVLLEALNAYAVPAQIRQLSERVGIQARRLCFYSPFRVAGWLAEAGLAPHDRRAVYLAPRRLPGLGRCLDHPGVRAALERLPGAALPVTHAYWLIARKAP